MSFAAEQLALTTTTRRDTQGATYARTRALALDYGGTGVSAAGANDAAKATNVLDTWGLTSSGIVLPAKYADMVGASSGAAGTKGAVPQPAAGKQYQTLRGDATFSTDHELDTVYATGGSGYRTARFVGPTVPAVDDAYLIFRSVNAGSRYVRIVGAVGGSDGFCDIRVEPAGLGRLTQFGDPLVTQMRGMRAWVNIPYTATFDAIGLPALTLDGTAASVTTNSSAHYVSLTSPGVGNTAGAYSAVCTQPQWALDTTFMVRTSASVATQRQWHGIFSADPIAGASLSGAGISGYGWRRDTGAGDSTWQAVVSNGATETVVNTTLAGTASRVYNLRVITDGVTYYFVSPAPVAQDANFGDWNLYATITTNVPTVSTGMLVASRIKDLSGGASVAFNLNRICCNWK